MSVLPQPVAPKSSGFESEVSTATSFNDLFRFFATKKLKVSKNSPPVLNKDVTEGEFILDKSALRIYVVVDQQLRYFQLT